LNIPDIDGSNNQFNSNKPIRAEEIKDPEAFAFFNEKINNKKLYNNRSSSSNIKNNNTNNIKVKKNIINNFHRNGSTEDIFRKHLYGGRDVTPTNCHKANITASKFRNENFMRNFYIDSKKEKIPLKEDSYSFINNKNNLNSNNENKINLINNFEFEKEKNGKYILFYIIQRNKNF